MKVLTGRFEAKILFSNSAPRFIQEKKYQFLKSIMDFPDTVDTKYGKIKKGVSGKIKLNANIPSGLFVNLEAIKSQHKR